MRSGWLFQAVCAVMLSCPAAAGPSFVPNPRQSFEGFVAINAPRSEVPVGALWIDGYGPTGGAAAPDNLETIRSLSGITIDRGLQLSLTAGLFNLIGIDPRYRDRFTARFTDLTIVRVRDVSRLSGPKGEPRIVEALKAGNVVVSTEGEVGLNARTIGFEVRRVEGTSSSGRTRSYAIEGRDLFIAIRVATPMLTSSREQELKLAHPANDLSARLEDYLLTLQGRGCDDHAGRRCVVERIGIVKLNSFSPDRPDVFTPLDEQGVARLQLPVPASDEEGGLYDALRVRWEAPCEVRPVEGCGRRGRLLAQFSGTRLHDLRFPDAKGW